LLRRLLGVEHWRHEEAGGKAITLIGSCGERGHRRVEVGIRKAGAIACVSQKIGDYGCGVRVEAVHARSGVDALDLD